VQAHSAGPGQGAEFVVWLPAGASRAIEPKTAPEEHPQAPVAGLKVLVVDDHPDMAESMARLFTMAGHEVRMAASGPAALEIAGEFLPDVIFLDIGLPEMDGYEVARRLRAAPATAGVRIITLTGYGRAQDRRRAEAGGFDHHLVKPVEFDRLQEVLASVSASRPR
jgi:CheY-like chemotaxis protein